MLRHRDRLALLDSVDDRAGFVLEFADPYRRLLHSGHILAKNGHKGGAAELLGVRLAQALASVESETGEDCHSPEDRRPKSKRLV